MPVHLSKGILYGQTVRSRQIGNFALSERIYPPYFKTPEHSHNGALFCFVMQGGYTEKYNNIIRECRSSTLLFHPPEEEHMEHFHETGGRSFLVELEPIWLKTLRDYTTFTNKSAQLKGESIELPVKRLYREFVQSDTSSPLIIEGLLMQMIGETSRSIKHHLNNNTPRWLINAKELIHARFNENLSLTDIAIAVGVHPVYLAQAFHKSYNSTIGDYVRQLRIDYACRQLEGETPIINIAHDAGFCDQSHFTRTFKRIMGIAPSKYRSLLRN